MTAYYNENDPFAAQWLRNLIVAGHIAPGVVDERSIVDVEPNDLYGFTQCHFFAGIGGWSLALRRAGWPDDRPVWSGSCPCQPYSAAGVGAGDDDPRNLWWAFRWLIDQHRPAVVFGEQVAAKAGRAWFNGVRVDLERMGYAVGAADLCAAGTGPEAQGRFNYPDGSERCETIINGAPHIRQRLFFGGRLDDSTNTRRAGAGQCETVGTTRNKTRVLEPTRPDSSDRLADSNGEQQQRWSNSEFESNCTINRLADSDEQQRDRGGDAGPRRRIEPAVGGTTSRLADSLGERCGKAGADIIGSAERIARTSDDLDRLVYAEDAGSTGESFGMLGATDQSNSDAPNILGCTDGKARRVESGTFPLANGVPARVGRLRGYGNAIVPQVAENFIVEFMAS